ncbi:MAG: YtxH domain-containing protein [Nitriliruptoraceae bacterium]
MHHDDEVTGSATGSDDIQLAPGGWRRVLIGFLLGALAGAAIGLVLPRDDDQHRPVRRG